jgi:hypothetical protein
MVALGLRAEQGRFSGKAGAGMAVSPTTRRYPRLKAPKSAVVAWKNAEQREVSHVATIALGGLFIQTKNPPKAGSTIQMLIVTPRGYLRTRASVRNVIAGEGMGVAIVSMEPEDRGKLERWLKQLAELERKTPAPQ